MTGPARQFEFDFFQRSRFGRDDEAEKARHRADRPTLDEKRNEDDDEDDVEERASDLEPGNDRQDRKKDRNRAAQSDPSEKDLLVPPEAEGRQADPDRDRARDKDQ